MSLQNFKAAVVARWEGYTPSADGTTSVYAFVDSLVEERGNGRHRELIWRLARGAQIVAQDELQHRWEIDCQLFIYRNDRTYTAFVSAVEQEAVGLAAYFSSLTVLGVGVWEGILRGFTIAEDEPLQPKRAGGVPTTLVAVVTFNFDVLTGEG